MSLRLFLQIMDKLQRGGPKLENDISINSSFRQKQLGVQDGCDSTNGTSYPLTEIYTVPVAYIPASLCTRNVVMYMYQQNDTCVIFFAGAAAIMEPLTQLLAMYMLCFGRVPHFTFLLLLCIRYPTLPIYV